MLLYTKLLLMTFGTTLVVPLTLHLCTRRSPSRLSRFTPRKRALVPIYSRLGGAWSQSGGFEACRSKNSGSSSP